MFALSCPVCLRRSSWLPAPTPDCERLPPPRLYIRSEASKPLLSASSGRANYRTRALLRSQQQAQTQTQPQPADEPVPAGCQRYSVTLSKPLGIVLEEDRHGSIYVAEVQAGGNAARTGLVNKGDMLIATSGYTYSREADYNEVRVRSGEKLVRLAVRNEDFNTVLAAIRSHPGHIQVKLEFQRC